MSKNEATRRSFIKTALTGTAAISFGGILPGFSAKSYASIIGANERIKVAMMGVNARGLALAKNFSLQPNCEVTYVCDVDSCNGRDSEGANTGLYRTFRLTEVLMQ